MPKSGRGRGKSFQKAKIKRSVPVAAAEQQVAAAPQQPMASTVGTVAPVKRPTATATGKARAAIGMAPVHPYIRGEIKKISLVAGIMIVILVILVFVLQ